MPISFSCTCGKRFTVQDDFVGKRTRCPICGEPLVVPDAPIPFQPESTLDSAATESSSTPFHRSTAPTTGGAKKAGVARLQPAPTSSADLQSLASDRYKHLESPSRSWREYAYWGLILTLIPLVFALLRTNDDSTIERFARSISAAPSEVQQRIERLASDEKGVQPSDIVDALPDGRIEGAHLARRTFVHFVYALLAAGAFFGIILLIVPGESVQPLPLLLIGAFTGTVGILLLLLVQFLSSWTQGRIVVGRNIFVMAIYWIVWAIGFSYRAALDADTSFIASFLGYTFGVGLCEEVCKALPLIWYFRRSERSDWRIACSWGLASGIGFGIAEAVMYAGDQYNGFATADIYVVRYVSCVALHAIWSAAVALFMFKHQGLIEGAVAWHDFIPRVVFLVSVPMILHGLYDTALKKDVNSVALVTALVSFAWLAWRIEVARREECDEPIAKHTRPARLRRS